MQFAVKKGPSNKNKQGEKRKKRTKKWKDFSSDLCELVMFTIKFMKNKSSSNTLKFRKGTQELNLESAQTKQVCNKR